MGSNKSPFRPSSTLLSIFALATCLLTLAAASTGYGQVWTDFNEHDPGIVAVEAMIPSFDELLGADSPSSAYELYTRFSISDNLTLIASLPISHYESSGTIFGDISETAVGNPYIGARFGSSPTTGMNFEAGIHLPLSSSDDTGLLTGLLIENHTLGRFLAETTTLSGAVRYYREQDSGLIIRAGGGPELWIPNEGDTELSLTYYAQLLYRADDLTFGAGLTGLTLITEGDLSYGDRTLNDIGLMGSYRFSGLRLGGYLRVPLDDEVNDFLNFVLGVQLGILL